MPLDRSSATQMRPSHLTPRPLQGNTVLVLVLVLGISHCRSRGVFMLPRWPRSRQYFVILPIHSPMGSERGCHRGLPHLKSRTASERLRALDNEPDIFLGLDPPPLLIPSMSTDLGLWQLPYAGERKKEVEKV